MLPAHTVGQYATAFGAVRSVDSRSLAAWVCQFGAAVQAVRGAKREPSHRDPPKEIPASHPNTIPIKPSTIHESECSSECEQSVSVGAVGIT